MPRHFACAAGHRWEFDPGEPDPDSAAVCLFCGAPGRVSDEPDAGEPEPTEPALIAPEPASAADPLPEVPGYRVVSRVGRGGMGDVYLARQAGTGRSVALKAPHLGAGLHELARFRAEASAAATVQHPGVVQLFEVGEAGGRPFLAMEYCPGGTLAGRLDGTPLPPRDAAKLAAHLARAADAAHRAGVVHRDLKPANVLLAADGTPKIADFGLARRVDGGDGITHSGAVIGTPAYMAPEQAYGRARHAGPPADVYSLGAILYQLLTGRPPFKGATPLETLEQLRNQDPVPPRRLAPEVPRDLETVCLKCLQKDPFRRYGAGGELADELERFLAGRPVLARPVGAAERFGKWARRNPRVAALLGLLALALAGAAGGAVRYQIELARERDKAVASLRVAVGSINELLTVVAEEDLVAEPRAEARRRRLLEQALLRSQDLLKLDARDPALRELAALAALRVGDVQKLLGRFPEASAAYAQALRQLEPLASASPGRTDLALHVAECRNSAGEVLRLTARPEEAAAEYRAARDFQKSVAEREPGNLAARLAWAQSSANLGLVLRDLGRLTDAREELGSAAALLRGGVGDARRWQLARALLNLGAALRLLREEAPAEAAYAEAVPLLEQLAADHEEEPKYRRELARALLNWGNLDPAAPASDARFGRSRELLARLSADFPLTPEFRADLANACNGLAAAAFGRKDSAAAERWLGESADAWRALLAKSPGVPDYRAGLGMALGNVGRVRLARGDAAGARAALDDGLRELAAALRANPAQPECRDALRRQCGDAAKAAARLSDPAPAYAQAEALASAVPAGAAGAAYGAYLLARLAWESPAHAAACADRALALLAGRAPADLAALAPLFAEPAFDPFRRDPRFATVLPKSEAPAAGLLQ